MLQAIENVFTKYEEPTQSCLFALHNITLKYNNQMAEGLKYGMPVITYNGKPFCYLWVDKKNYYPYLLIVKGDMIEHPDLEKGDRKKMKTFTVNPHEDIPVGKIYEIFELAIGLY
jgi:hypothetical protein